jgi:hypothetical protein
VLRWTKQGVQAHIIDVPSAKHEELVELLRGVDYLVSFVGGNGIESQKQLFRAAKDANVSRVVPSDFSINCPPGLMLLHDVVSLSQIYVAPGSRYLTISHRSLAYGNMFAPSVFRIHSSRWVQSPKAFYHAQQTIRPPGAQ